MIRSMMAGKIHRATVTQANVDYEGSITIDPDLMDAAGILQYELVQVLDITNGARLETYAIEGTRGSGEVCVNGAAGLLVRDRDLVIILHFIQMSEEEACLMKPKVVRVDKNNKIVSTTDKIEAHTLY
ncbi:MAG: aspartate 1-decarboxylase [Chloroflexota bacterium]|jgi:aspartate 1-decarboxylase|nr:aspartate 1-decarboxylase [Chloroflexota bacterium]